MSAGFVAGGRQEWRRPERPGAPPLVIRRNAEVVEVSLVLEGAYDNARVVSVNQRTAQAQHNHEVAQEMFAEYRARKARTHRESVRAIVETQVAVRKAGEYLERRGYGDGS